MFQFKMTINYPHVNKKYIILAIQSPFSFILVTNEDDIVFNKLFNLYTTGITGLIGTFYYSHCINHILNTGV